MERVVVTGLGTVSSYGCGTDRFADAIMAGEVGIRPHVLALGEHETEVVAARFAGYATEDHLEHTHASRWDRTVQFAVIAAHEAWHHAGLDDAVIDGERTGVVIGTGIGSWDTLETAFEGVLCTQRHTASPMTIPKIMPNAAPSAISMEFGLQGPAMAVSTACASGNHAIATAVQWLRAGLVERVIAGGAEASLTFSGMRGWQAMRITAKDTCRPFSVDRQGLVLGEGAGMLVLETLTAAEQRHATVLAEVTGVGLSADASDLVQPSASGIALAMQRALADHGGNPIDYVNAHGTGTLANDRTEVAALKAVFGPTADALAISSTKSMHGHCLGAAGGVEAIATVLAIQHQRVPPTMNYLGPDPDCDLGIVTEKAQARPIASAMSNAFAFGGLNAVIVFSAFDDAA